MSTSDPRTSGSSPASGPTRSTAHIDADALKSTVPLSSHVLLVGIMLLFFTVATLITLQVGWIWWLIPAVIAVPVLVVLVERTNRMLKAREAARVMAADLRSAAPRPGTTGSSR